MASQAEQNFEQYLQGVEFPASKEELVSAAKSNDAPQHLIEHLEGLKDGATYSGVEELSVAEGYEEQATEQRES
jgi:hypothetical protein